VSVSCPISPAHTATCIRVFNMRRVAQALSSILVIFGSVFIFMGLQQRY
jgi:hypothetical protein